MTLKELIEWFIERASNDLGRVRMDLFTAVNIAKIATGDEGDFVVFNNGRFRPLVVWSGGVASTMVTLRPSYTIYAYRLDGEDHVMQTPVRAGGNLGNYIEWKEIDGEA